MPVNKDDIGDEPLESKVTEAFLQKDYAGVIALLRAEKTLDDSFKGSVLSTAITAPSLAVVKYIFEEAKIELSAPSAMLLLLDAANKQHTDIAIYLCERNTELGLVRADSYNIVLEKFPEENHAAILDKIASATPEKQDALDSLMAAAADTKKFDALSHAIDLGANVNVGGDSLLTKILLSKPEEFFSDKEKYLGLVEKFFTHGYTGGIVLDASLTLAAHLSVAGGQYPEVVDIMLDNGADPFFGNRAAETLLREKLEETGDSERLGAVKLRFAKARKDYTATARHEFQTMFKDDFRLQDLREYADDHGDNGFTLAAKARLLDKVMGRAIEEGPLSLQVGDLTRQNSEKRTFMSYATDRGDQNQLLDINYWSRRAQTLISGLADNLGETEKKAIDFAGLNAGFQHQVLRSKARPFKLAAG